MKLSVKNGTKADFKPVTVDGPGALAELITKSAYSPGTFKNEHRNLKNFEGAELIGLDFDDGYTLEEAKEKFKDQWHIIGTTKSHQIEKGNKPACDRFRVLLKAEREITDSDDYKATVKAIIGDLPADTACTDASRYFDKCKEIVSTNTEGKLQPLFYYVKPELSDKPPVASYVRGQLGRGTLEFIAFGTSVNFNRALHKAARDLHQAQYSQEEAIALLENAAKNYEGSLNSKDLESINSAYKEEPRHAPRGVESMFDFKHPSEMSSNGVDIDWLVDGAMGCGAISIMAGPPKSGKSTLTRQLAIATARGGEWLGRKVKQAPVLYLALEEQEAMLKLQLTKAGLQKDDQIFMHCGRPMPGDIKQNLIQAIQSYKAGLVIVDTLLLLSSFSDINNYNEAYAQLNPFREIARETGAHLLMIHHTNKMGTMMGSQGLLGAVDCGMTLSMILGDPNRRKLDSLQRGGRPFHNCVLEYNNDFDSYAKATNQNEGL